MLFNIAVVMAAVNCITVNSAPVDPQANATTSITTSAEEFLFAPHGLGFLRTNQEVSAALERVNRTSDADGPAPRHVTHQLSRRAMTLGKKYSVSGWVVTVARYAVEQYTGTYWKFPTDGLSVAYIADQVAGSFTRVIGNGEVDRNVGGGWSWHARIFQDNYEFNGFPYNLVYSLVFDAIKGSTDWITNDNAFEFAINSQDGRGALMVLRVYPTVRGALSSVHNEL